MSNELIQLIEANPDLPIIPMVGQEVVGEDVPTYWMGKWGKHYDIQSILEAMRT
jgi:hypothetical protein